MSFKNLNSPFQFVWLFLTLFLISCTDHKKEITITYPEYNPKLIVIASAGPLSGASALVKWSLPYPQQKATVPELPDLSIYLLENGQRIGQFKSDSIGYFSINYKTLVLQEDEKYAIELILASGERLVSEEYALPPKPIIKHVDAQIVSGNPNWYDLTLLQSTSKGFLGAVSILPVLFNENREPFFKPDIFTYLSTSEFQYVESNNLPEQRIRKRFSRVYQNKEGDTIISNAVDIRMVYLSSELATLKKQVDELASKGESIYQTSGSITTNIKGTIGVFGLYNEVNQVVSIQ